MQQDVPAAWSEGLQEHSSPMNPCIQRLRSRWSRRDSGSTMTRASVVGRAAGVRTSGTLAPDRGVVSRTAGIQAWSAGFIHGCSWWAGS
jgi:hypothetical protein